MSLKITKHFGGLYTLYTKEKVTAPIDLVWKFFSQPKNLNTLTPPDLNFNLCTGKKDIFYEGKIFSYKIELLSFLQFNWISEISKVDKNHYFIDKQLFGPYKLWHHEHHFKDNKDGTIEIIDKVKYKLYLHPFSKIIHKLFIAKKLTHIFNYRKMMINKIFNINN